MPNGTCRVCGGLPSVKDRRVIFTRYFEASKEIEEIVGVISEDDGGSHYVCRQCHCKLLKLKHLSHEIKTKVIQLEMDRNKIISELQEKYSISNHNATAMVMTTPIKKRPHKSATPPSVKVKEKRLMRSPITLHKTSQVANVQVHPTI